MRGAGDVSGDGDGDITLKKLQIRGREGEGRRTGSSEGEASGRSN
jgi:hypothetical protein